MARADLSKMLGNLEDPEPAVAEAPEAGETPPAPKAAPAKRSRPVASPKPASSGVTPVAGYQSFERKEARLRADQYAQLTEASRRLNRAKGTGGERITENTLIRVAIDLLLERADRLSGATETELRNSVSL